MVPFGDISNIPSFYTAPEYFHYSAFASTYEAFEACQIAKVTIILPDMMKYKEDQ